MIIIIEEISVNNYLVEVIKLGETNGQKCARIIDKSFNQISSNDRMIITLTNLSDPNLIRILEILEDDKMINIFIVFSVISFGSGPIINRTNDFSR